MRLFFNYLIEKQSHIYFVDLPLFEKLSVDFSTLTCFFIIFANLSKGALFRWRTIMRQYGSDGCLISMV